MKRILPSDERCVARGIQRLSHGLNTDQTRTCFRVPSAFHLWLTPLFVQFVLFVVSAVLCFASLAPSREARSKLRGHSRKTLPKWDKSCHICGFPEENRGAAELAKVPNVAKQVPNSVKPVPKVPNLALSSDDGKHSCQYQPEAPARTDGFPR